MENNHNKKLAKNTIIILFSKILTQLSSILILPFLTACLNTEEYGMFDLISSYAWLLVPYLSLEIENGIFRFLIDARNDKRIKKKKEIISSGVSLVLIQLIFSSIIFFIIFEIFKNINIFYVYIYAIFATIMNLNLFIARGLDKTLDYAISSIIAGSLNILLSFCFIYIFNLSVWGLVLSGVISNFCASIYIFIKLKIYKFIHVKLINKDKKIKLLKFSVPLVPNATSSWITSISDRTMISLFIGTSANGIYSIATKFPILLSHLTNVFNLSWSEVASETVNEEYRDDYYSKTTDNIFFLCFSISIMMISVMPILFKICIDERYFDALKYVPYLMIGSIFEIFSILLGSLYISLKKSKNIAISTGGAALINIVINLCFMKRYGIIIACISTILSYLFLGIYRLIDLRKYIKLKLNYKKYIIASITLLLILFLYSRNINARVIVSIVVSIIIGVYLNKEILISIINRLKKEIIVKRLY